MRFFSPLSLALSVAALVFAAVPRSQSDASPSSMVTWDEHSIKIKGERVMIYSAEVHGFRYPGYSSLVEVFQKLRAAGFNAVSTYFFWGMVEHQRGLFNWESFRDPTVIFNAAKEAGIYIIARPGPYINAEVSAGGLPGWLQRIPGPARNSAENYTQAFMPYINTIFEAIARNQIDRGGPIIAVQLENEYDQAIGGEDFDYEEILKNAAADAGITVPTTHNGALSSGFGDYFIDNVDIWGYDEYPVGNTVCPNPDNWADTAIQQFQWTMHLEAAYNRGQPMAVYEFEGGIKQGWGDVGYCDQLAGVAFQRMFYKNKYSMGTTIFNIYMGWGGTNWGNIASPDCYTSYDYGSMIAEDRQLRTKYYEAKTQGQFLRSSPAFLTAYPQNIGDNNNSFVASSEDSLTVTYSFDMEGGKTKFFFVRHTAASYSGETSYSLTLATSQGNLTIPQLGGNLTLLGRDTKIHVVDYAVGKHTLLYSSAEVMTSLIIDGITTVVIYGDSGQEHETAIVASGKPTFEAFGDGVDSITSHATGKSLILNYRTVGKTVIKVADDLLLYVLDRETAYLTWPNLENSVLVLGGYLIRNAQPSWNGVQITGDFNETTLLEILAPSKLSHISVNGQNLAVSTTEYGAKTVTVVPQLPKVQLPTLQSLTWKAANSLPELSKSYDDSRWTTADLVNTTNPNKPQTPVSLYAGDYGYHHGIILWRGHFIASGGEALLTLNVSGGAGFGYSAFDNGVLISSFAGNKNADNDLATITLPTAWATNEEHIITIIQDHMGYSLSWEANTELYKDPRGICAYSLADKHGSVVVSKSVEWKVQGNLGGEDYTDQIRGPFNEGGLYAERMGWHLPDFPDYSWNSSSPLTGISGPGTQFYRTSFNLNIPGGVDYPISLQLPAISSINPYRALIYVNGFQFGRYISSLGPQTNFPIPPTILNLSGKNTLALALWAMGTDGAAFGSLSLEIDAKVTYGGPKFVMEEAPAYNKEERSNAS